MNNGKFDMFADCNDIIEEQKDEFLTFEDDESEVISTTVIGDTKRKYSSLPTRTPEEYEAMIDHVYYEKHIHPVTNEEYNVRVTVFKPEINPMQNLKPAFAFATNH